MAWPFAIIVDFIVGFNYTHDIGRWHLKNSLITFLVGLAMLVAGLFWLTSMMQVTTMWGAGFRIGGTNVPSGLTLVPLIAGIVWIFFNPKAVGAKILCAVVVIIIIASIIMSVRFHVPRVSLFEFILVFVGIAGGAGLIARVLFTDPNKKRSSNDGDRK